MACPDGHPLKKYTKAVSRKIDDGEGKMEDDDGIELLCLRCEEYYAIQVKEGKGKKGPPEPETILPANTHYFRCGDTEKCGEVDYCKECVSCWDCFEMMFYIK